MNNTVSHGKNSFHSGGSLAGVDLVNNILKSPEAKKMKDMVTKGFYDRSRIGLWIYEAIGREYDEMLGWAQNICLEAFPQTCTWSIAVWEWIYGITTDETLPLTVRRGKIMSKKLQAPPINPARIEAILSALTGEAVAVTENTAPCTFSVVVNMSEGSTYNYREAIKTLRGIKPSHLSFIYESRMPASYAGDTYAAGAALFSMPLVFPDEAIEDINLNSTCNVSGAVAVVPNFIFSDEAIENINLKCGNSTAGAALFSMPLVFPDEAIEDITIKSNSYTTFALGLTPKLLFLDEFCDSIDGYSHKYAGCSASIMPKLLFLDKQWDSTDIYTNGFTACAASIVPKLFFS